MNLAPLIRTGWWMALGERAAIEGLLALLQPTLAIELGTGEGGSLARIAAHSAEVHTFDFSPRVAKAPENVVFHRGDSHVLLPALLRRLEESRRNVDLVLVDGDHTLAGVKRDLEDLLSSDAIARSVIIVHDTMNEDVRSGIESVQFERYSKVVYVDLDFVLSYQAGRSALDDFWGGLGLVVVDADGTLDFEQFRHFRMGEDESIVPRNRSKTSIGNASRSWRLAAPVRRLKRRVRARAGAAYKGLRSRSRR